MCVEEAQRRLDMTQHTLNGCEAHLYRTFNELRKGELARGGNNKLYYALTRTLGHGYMKRLTEARDSAEREWKEANEEVRRAEEELRKAEATCRGGGSSCNA